MKRILRHTAESVIAIVIVAVIAYIAIYYVINMTDAGIAMKQALYDRQAVCFFTGAVEQAVCESANMLVETLQTLRLM